MSAPTPARPEFYVPLPRRLLEDLRDSALAVGVYALVARLFRATRAPVPLSPADLQSLDPGISYGGATRAFQRLAAGGYLAVDRRRGQKSAYTPTWGVVAGEARLWDLAAPYLGRPRHIRDLHLPQRLLDTCVGRLDPHPVHGARISRYLTAPLLGLADVGSYGLALLGLPVESAALTALGLLAAGLPQPLPGEDDILAAASQRQLLDQAHPVALSAAGWARTAFALPTHAPHAGGQVLFFVPKDQIARPIDRMIARPITGQPEQQEQITASRRPRGRAVPEVGRSHVGECNKEKNPPHPNQTSRAERQAGGYSSSSDQPGESEQLLRELGVRAEVARSLADRPPQQVRRLIARARARPGIHDRAGWVVSALRAISAAAEPADPTVAVSDITILTHPGLANNERMRWLSRFRNADPIDRAGVLARLFVEHPPEQYDARPA